LLLQMVKRQTANYLAGDDGRRAGTFARAKAALPSGVRALLDEARVLPHGQHHSDALLFAVELAVRTAGTGVVEQLSNSFPQTALVLHNLANSAYAIHVGVLAAAAVLEPPRAR